MTPGEEGGKLTALGASAAAGSAASAAAAAASASASASAAAAAAASAAASAAAARDVGGEGGEVPSSAARRCLMVGRKTWI